MAPQEIVDTRTDEPVRIGKSTQLKGKSNFYAVETQGHHLHTFLDTVQKDFRKILSQHKM